MNREAEWPDLRTKIAAFQYPECIFPVFSGSTPYKGLLYELMPSAEESFAQTAKPGAAAQASRTRATLAEGDRLGLPECTQARHAPKVSCRARVRNISGVLW